MIVTMVVRPWDGDPEVVVTVQCESQEELDRLVATVGKKITVAVVGE